jgi:hypothetical protein
MATQLIINWEEPDLKVRPFYPGSHACSRSSALNPRVAYYQRDRSSEEDEEEGAEDEGTQAGETLGLKPCVRLEALTQRLGHTHN